MFRQLAILASVVGGVAAIAPAAVIPSVTLSFQVDTTAKTWKVYGQTSPDTKGLASIYIDVTGTSGVSIVSSQVKAPQTPVYDVDSNFVGTAGFTSYRSNGVNGVGITAGQDPNASAELILLNYGVATPGLLAQGTYSGATGFLNANVHSGGFINVYPLTYTAGGSTTAATVVSSQVAVPEPTVMGLGMLGAGLLAMRRKRNIA